MHTKTIQKIQKAYIKTYEKDVKIYKDIENSQGTLLLQKCRPLYSEEFLGPILHVQEESDTKSTRKQSEQLLIRFFTFRKELTTKSET